MLLVLATKSQHKLNSYLGLENGDSDSAKSSTSTPPTRSRKPGILHIVGAKFVAARPRARPVDLHDRVVAIIETELALGAGAGILPTTRSKGKASSVGDDFVVNGVRADLLTFLGVLIELAPVNVEVLDLQVTTGAVDELQLDKLIVTHGNSWEVWYCFVLRAKDAEEE